MDCFNLIRVEFNSEVGDHITQKLAKAHSKRTLSDIEVQFVSPQYLKDFFEIIYVLELHLTLYHHIIYVDLDVLAQLWFEHPGHHSLIRRPCILQPKRYHFQMIIPCGCNERSLLLIAQRQGYLVISLESIQEAHLRMACGCIHQLIYPRQKGKDPLGNPYLNL